MNVPRDAVICLNCADLICFILLYSVTNGIVINLCVFSKQQVAMYLVNQVYCLLSLNC